MREQGTEVGVGGNAVGDVLQARAEARASAGVLVSKMGGGEGSAEKLVETVVKPVRQLVCEAAAVATGRGASTAFGDPMEIYEARGELAEWMIKWKHQNVGAAQFVALWDVADKLLRSLRSPVLNQQFNVEGAECFGVAAEAAVRERK